MQVMVIPQVEIGNVHRIRIGDVLNTGIADASCQRFRFAVAYMRMSGWNRLAASIDSLLNRGGHVSGAVGVDNGVTSIEALQFLRRISTNSTIFHTTSGFIYHPKLYLMNGDSRAVALIGSANLTRDGLFRNIEVATAVHLDFNSSVDLEVYTRYDEFMNGLLDTTHPNVQHITDETLDALSVAGLIKGEATTQEPGPGTRSRRATRTRPQTDLRRLFPPLRVPVAPPLDMIPTRQPVPQRPIVIPPATVGAVSTFVMQLSSFDSSHKTGVPGTPEILIPHAAIGFFPPLSLAGRKYPDVIFDVVLNTETGRERHTYRLWYYEERAIGTRIDEYRLRLDHDTIDLSSPGGGDLIVINRLPPGNGPLYEVTILPQSDPTFPAFLSLCTKQIYEKRWGIV
jgi:HKD family nuclease